MENKSLKLQILNTQNNYKLNIILLCTKTTSIRKWFCLISFNGLRSDFMKKVFLQIIPIMAIILLLSACNGNENMNQEETDKSEDNNEAVEEPLTLREISDEIIKALDTRDMDTIANYVDPEDGLLFSPYVYVIDEAVVFEKNEVASLLESNEKYNWGSYDGKGTPIELTPSEYFDEFLNMTAYQDPDSVLKNDPQHRGNTKNNLKERFPEAELIEYYADGSEEYAGMDWSSIYLVYKKDDTEHLQLIAIIRDMWTI